MIYNSSKRYIYINTNQHETTYNNTHQNNISQNDINTYISVQNKTL